MERVSAYAEGVRHERAMSESAAHGESTWTRKRTTAEGLMGRFWTFYSKVAQAYGVCNLRERTLRCAASPARSAPSFCANPPPSPVHLHTRSVCAVRLFQSVCVRLLGSAGPRGLHPAGVDETQKCSP